MHPTGGTVTADGAPINLTPAKVLDFGISLSQVGRMRHPHASFSESASLNDASAS